MRETSAGHSSWQDSGLFHLPCSFAKAANPPPWFFGRYSCHANCSGLFIFECLLMASRPHCSPAPSLNCFICLILLQSLLLNILCATLATPIAPDNLILNVHCIFCSWLKNSSTNEEMKKFSVVKISGMPFVQNTVYVIPSCTWWQSLSSASPSAWNASLPRNAFPNAFKISASILFRSYPLSKLSSTLMIGTKHWQAAQDLWEKQRLQYATLQHKPPPCTGHHTKSGSQSSHKEFQFVLAVWRDLSTRTSCNI